MYIKFNNASYIADYQDVNCTTPTGHMSLDTNTCHYLGASDYAMVLYTTDNYTVTLARVDPNYNSSTVKQTNMYLSFIVIICIMLITL